MHRCVVILTSTTEYEKAWFVNAWTRPSSVDVQFRTRAQAGARVLRVSRVRVSSMARKYPTRKRRVVFFFLTAAAITVVTLAVSKSRWYSVVRPNPATMVGPSKRSSETGYVLAFKYNDQLTGGAVNLLSLMCLATKFGGVRVVEPFVINSDFGLNTSKKLTEQLKFRDINDISVWENYTSSTQHYYPLVSYDTFIKDAPRKVLLVQYYYPCGDQTVWSMAREFCDTNGFELVGKVCLTYGEGKMFTIDMLENQIYSHFNKSEVVVLFEIYGGIEEQLYSSNRAYRIFARNTKCDRHTVNDDYKAAYPSPSVFSDANAYVQRYLKGNSSYISLMIRLERILRLSKAWNSQDSAQYARQCLTNTLKRWRDIKQRTGIATTFLAIDVGMYGSNEFCRHPEIEKAVLPPVEEFLSAVYDKKTSLREWEDTFSSVGLGRTKTSGYIAMMQKVVGVKGSVLMLVGAKSSSSFQTSGIRLYHKFHGKGQVIQLDNKCS